jgi:hypothetical protein
LHPELLSAPWGGRIYGRISSARLAGQYCPGDGQAFNCPNGFEPTSDQKGCIVICDAGFEPNASGKQCVAIPPTTTPGPSP